MSIKQIIDESERCAPFLENTDPNRVLEAAARRRKRPRDLALLLSRGADEVLAALCDRAHHITLARFGKAMQLYAPLYISNHCVGSCLYCGFRGDKRIKRRDLSIEEIEADAAHLVDANLRHVLIVAGEDPRRVDIDRLVLTVQRLKQMVPSVSIEVAPLEEDDYRRLAEVGLDGVTLYQETYDAERYATYHKKGPKADFAFRLEAMDRAGRAGIHKLTVGSLWGLAPWREEALMLGMHTAHLQKTHWKSTIAMGLPRLKEVPDDFSIPFPVEDRAFAHIIAAMRIYFEDAGLVLSTREPEGLREKLIPLGVTQMSAGSKTEPGGYSAPGEATDQFPVSDERKPEEVADALASLGYDPVWKDWERTFGGARD